MPQYHFMQHVLELAVHSWPDLVLWSEDSPSQDLVTWYLCTDHDSELLVSWFYL